MLPTFVSQAAGMPAGVFLNDLSSVLLILSTSLCLGLLTWLVRLSRNTRVLRHHLSEIRKAKDQLDQAMCSLEAYGERPKAFFPDSPVHKAVTADHIVLDSPVRGRMCDVIERWSEAWMNSDQRWCSNHGVLVFSCLFELFLSFPIFSYFFPCVFVILCHSSADIRA